MFIETSGQNKEKRSVPICKLIFWAKCSTIHQCWMLFEEAFHIDNNIHPHTHTHIHPETHIRLMFDWTHKMEFCLSKTIHHHISSSVHLISCLVDRCGGFHLYWCLKIELIYCLWHSIMIIIIIGRCLWTESR